MTDSSSDPTACADQRRTDASLVSRRRFLAGAGAALGFGALALVRVDPAAATGRADQLNEPGAALVPAVRVTTTTTTPPTTTIPLQPNEILFPIIVGEDDFCWVSDSFGDCRGSGCSRSHEGVDIMADRGLPVRAPVAGRLTKRYDDYGSSSGAGNGWTLYDEVEDITYKAFHLDRHADGLEVDDEVAAGQVIGYVGNTGTSGIYSNTNYHLHFEYRPGNVPADPFHLLQRDPNVSFES